jgi:hypothetical protein
VFTIDETKRFQKRRNKLLSPEEIRKLPALLERLAKNPSIGDSLGSPWFREVRMSGKRLYYIVGKSRLLFVDVSGKKDQQEIIDFHLRYVEMIRRELN